MHLMLAEAETSALKDACFIRAISMVAASKGTAEQGQDHGQATAPSPATAQPRWGADSGSQAATQLYSAADTATSMQGCCHGDTESSCCGVEAVAEAVMQQGCCDEEGRTVQAIKPFLPGALQALSKVHGASRCASLLYSHQVLSACSCMKAATPGAECLQSIKSGVVKACMHCNLLSGLLGLQSPCELMLQRSAIRKQQCDSCNSLQSGMHCCCSCRQCHPASDKCHISSPSKFLRRSAECEGICTAALLRSTK